MIRFRNPFAPRSTAPASKNAPSVESLRRIVRTSYRAGFEAARRVAERVPKAFLVGGAVRDALLGHEADDVDLEVYGLPADDLKRLLESLFPGAVHDVGATFGILKVHLGDGSDLDVALPRHDSKVGSGHRGFAITGDPSMAPEHAVRRRDFTINALLADPKTGELTDFVNGLKDLEQRTLRAVDPEHFAEDPLRVYRATQLAARFDLTVDSETQSLLRDMVARGYLDELAKERVTDEWRKLFLKAERPSIGLTLAKELGIVHEYFPELEALKHTEQEPEWHPEGDVWIHTLMVVDQAAKIIRQPERGFTDDERLAVMLGALCHDLGKPATTKVEEGRIRSRGHEAAGVEAARSFMAHFTFGEAAGRAAEAVAAEHLKPIMLFRSREAGQLTEAQYLNAVRKLVKRIYPVHWRVLLAAAESDTRGRSIPNAETEPYRAGDAFIAGMAELGLDKKPPQPLIQGQDLLDLGVAPGPRMGELIAHIENLRDDGTITTKEEALTELKRVLNS